MDKPEDYYAILGVPIDADSDMLKRAYRQLARRFHPDLAGPDGALEMKRINRAYAVLSDPEQRQHYDTIIGGVIDLRRQHIMKPRPQTRMGEGNDEFDFATLNIFSTKGPFHAGPVIHSTIGIISAITSIRTVQGLLIAAGSLDGKGVVWQVVQKTVKPAVMFASDPQLTLESIRELRISAGGALLGGWGRLGLHVWDAYSGELLWSHSLIQRAVADHYSLDMQLQGNASGKQTVTMALPHLTIDARAPRAWGVRGSDIVQHQIGQANPILSEALQCTEESLEKRNFWAIRMRALSQDQQALVTLSCGQVPNEPEQTAVVRRWNLTSKARLSNRLQSQISRSILLGRCEDCRPPYTITPDAKTIAFVYAGNKIRLCDTTNGTYSEILSGPMGGNARLAISPDGQWLAVAREDSEVNEGVIDLWSTVSGQIIQKFYHPWQISALHFAEQQLVVAQTDGAIQIWQ